jgi:hypothetical protein
MRDITDIHSLPGGAQQDARGAAGGGGAQGYRESQRGRSPKEMSAVHLAYFV